ncbi:MAG: helix-turn-helix domain-containing protein [Elainellaceae cyanobacterium]
MQQRSNPLLDDSTHSFGTLLKQWRTQRGFSQLELSLASRVSQRHISFLESGRAKPSRDMVLELAAVLDVPARQQNLMLTTVGFAPIHTETDLSAPEMTSIRKALDFMLRQQEPYPAVVVDRYWNLLLSNDAATHLLATFIDLGALHTRFSMDGKVNLMQAMFHPHGLRPFIVNWPECAEHLLHRVRREATSEGNSEQSTQLLTNLMSYPEVAERWQDSNRVQQNTLLLTVHFKRDALDLKFFSTIATLGTAYDITLQELRIECLFPADEATERYWKHMDKRDR